MADMMTEEQIQEFKEGFQLFDTKKCGSIPSGILGVVMRSLGQIPTDDELAEHIKQHQKEDGTISFAEFLAIMAPKFDCGGGEASVDDEFIKADKDGSGFLTLEEIRHVLANLGENLSEEEMNEYMKHAEVESNGKVDYKKFTRMLMSIY